MFIGYLTKVFHIPLITGSSHGIRCATLLGESVNATKNNVRLHIEISRAPEMGTHSP
jgi:hypothetical protein